MATTTLSRFMPVIVLSLTGYSYYVFVFRICVRPLLSSDGKTTQAVIYIAVESVLLFLVLFTYFRTLFRKPGFPPNPQTAPSSIPVASTTTVDQSKSSLAPFSYFCTLLRKPGPPPDQQAATPATTMLQNQPPPDITITTSPPSLTTNTTNLSPYDRDTDIQPMENAHLRTSNPLPTIIEDGNTETAETTTIGSSSTSTPSQRPTPMQQSYTILPMPSTFVSKKDGRVRWCDRCNRVKPDRCHHCSECDACVLKMDHHCPWVNGCVGFQNYKFFYLFILYTSLYADFTAAATIPAIVEELRGDYELDIQWIILIILAFLFGLLLSGFTVVHTTYLFLNLTTIESISVKTRQYHVRIQFDPENPIGYGVAQTNPGENLWNLGWKNNFKVVMGDKWYLWFVPFGRPVGDGLEFTFNESVHSRLAIDAKRQAQIHEERMAMMMQAHGTGRWRDHD